MCNTMKNSKILFVNHKPQKCGVYEFGYSVGNILTQSTKYNFVYREADSWREFYRIFQKENPNVVIYNYYPCTMGWIGTNSGILINSHKIRIIQIGILHEVTQKIADHSNDIIFDYHIAPDPTLILNNPIVYKTGRLVPRFQSVPIKNEIINIGSFGFATNGKGFLKIIKTVQDEFDEAKINLNISYAKFGDEKGDNARELAKQARELVTKKDIVLNISHEHLSTDEILKFLSKNDINVFLYDYLNERGISSAIDYAIAVKRPLAITKSSMFRHLFHCKPSICIEDNSLRTILGNGISHIEKLCDEWSPEKLLANYEKIIENIVDKSETRELKSPIQKRLMQIKYISSKLVNRIFTSFDGVNGG